MPNKNAKFFGIVVHFSKCRNCRSWAAQDLVPPSYSKYGDGEVHCLANEKSIASIQHCIIFGDLQLQGVAQFFRTYVDAAGCPFTW